MNNITVEGVWTVMNWVAITFVGLFITIMVAAYIEYNDTKKFNNDIDILANRIRELIRTCNERELIVLCGEIYTFSDMTKETLFTRHPDIHKFYCEHFWNEITEGEIRDNLKRYSKDPVKAFEEDEDNETDEKINAGTEENS